MNNNQLNTNTNKAIVVISNNNSSTISLKPNDGTTSTSTTKIVNQYVPIVSAAEPLPSSKPNIQVNVVQQQQQQQSSHHRNNSNNNKKKNQHPANENKRKMPTSSHGNSGGGAVLRSTMHADNRDNNLLSVTTTTTTTNGTDNLKLTDGGNRPTEKKHKGGFLSRFSGFRFSLRGKKKKIYENNNAAAAAVVMLPPPPSESVSVSSSVRKSVDTIKNNVNKDIIYIPLKDPLLANNETADNNSIVLRGSGGGLANSSRQPPPPSHFQTENATVVTTKPPLPRQPPRVVGVCAKSSMQQLGGRNAAALAATGRHAQRASSAPREIDVTDHLHRYRQPSIDSDVSAYQSQYRRDMIASGFGGDGSTTAAASGVLRYGEHKIGLIETNLDTHETVISGKTQSLMELGPQIMSGGVGGGGGHGDTIDNHGGGGGNGVGRTQSSAANRMSSAGIIEPRRPHKSMEFLLDKDNQKQILVSLIFLFLFFSHINCVK